MSAQQYRDQPQKIRGAYEGPGTNNFGGMVGGGQRGSYGAGGYEDRDANGERYAARIYMEPEYYGYESNFPGGRANFKAYRSSPEGGKCTVIIIIHVEIAWGSYPTILMSYKAKFFFHQITDESTLKFIS